MPQMIVVAHNIRSTHNVGAIFRTCEGFGVERLVLSGYSPYPTIAHDTRLPHISRKITEQIHKTALGAEALVPFTYQEKLDINALKQCGYHVIGLEQSDRSIILPSYHAPDKIVLILGEEIDGISPELLNLCDDVIEIPMVGHKESFNVSVAAGIALYHLSEIS